MNSYFGTCVTDGDIAIKDVVLSQTWPEDGDAGPYLLSVLFDKENITIAPQIQLKNPDETNIGSATNISLFNYEGGSAGVGEAKSWAHGTMVTFIYNGSVYFITNYHNYLMPEDLEGYVNTDNFKTVAGNNLLSGTASNAINANTAIITANENNLYYKRPASTLIPYVHQLARVGYNEKYTDEDYWYCVASTTLSTINEDRHIIFHVSDKMENSKSGILNIRARSQNTSDSVAVFVNLDWEYNNNYTTSDFMVLTNGNIEGYDPRAGKTCSIQLWTRVTANWTPRVFEVLSQGTRSGIYYSDMWTLYTNFTDVHYKRYASPQEGFWDTIEESPVATPLTYRESSNLTLNAGAITATTGTINGLSILGRTITAQAAANSTSHSYISCNGANSSTNYNPSIYLWARNFNGTAETYNMGIWGHDTAGNAFGILDATNSSNMRFYGQSDYISDYHNPNKKLEATYWFSAAEYPEDTAATNWACMYRPVNDNEVRLIPVSLNTLKTALNVVSAPTTTSINSRTFGDGKHLFDIDVVINTSSDKQPAYLYQGHRLGLMIGTHGITLFDISDNWKELWTINGTIPTT